VEAPDFTLKDHNRQSVRLSSHRGIRPVLLVFYPYAFSRTCQGELDGLRDEFGAYDGVQVYGISVDTPYSLKVWAAERGYQFPLLSDFWPHGEVAQAYDTFDPVNGMAKRGTFLVDVAGVIRFAEVNEPGEPRDQRAWHHAVAALAADQGV